MPESSGHIVKSFEQELARLRELLIEMGGIVESQLAMALQALMQKDAELASRAIESDVRVDALEREIEQFAIRLIALRQPVADDLRRIVGALKITVDLERIGDYAANVAKRSIVLSGLSLPFSLTGLMHMAEMVQEQLKLIVDAIGDTDIEKAISVWQSDERVDDLYVVVFRELITYMMEDPRNITPCTHLLFISKNLERIGDHATNIAETLHYTMTGQVLSQERPKGDRTVYYADRPERG
ncbi:MAG: phosphate signaling complex protein PhoU [Acidobacteriia bacterium]|nr:phosphate signaling complex protein PhoU [Methyloceanibacter sp.]MBX5470959.1 phosphate signaling complex protein PhoU [Acetobacteraceae bacterium]MCL6490336.1 phosphate signaling complex protein PhoU [Terriglobia bacterium]